MGVSKFHAWMNERFGEAVSETRGEILTADHVLVDLATVTHGAARRCKSGRDAVKRVIGRVESIFSGPKAGSAHSVCRARRSVGLFGDGPRGIPTDSGYGST